MERAAAVIRDRTGVDRHDVFVVLGSGWAESADVLPAGIDVPVDAVPGFLVPGVSGHRPTLRSLAVGPACVLLSLGRVHLYEGHRPADVVHPVRVAAAAGCRIALLTNAAGAIDPSFPVGSAVLVRDQINMTGVSPLTGPAFVDLTDLYSARLRDVVRGVDPTLPDGVYVGTHGPEFETPAEIRAYRSMGADLVGMSTVLEAIAARQAGMEVVGLSMVTNLAAGVGGPLDPAHVWDAAALARPAMSSLLSRVVSALADAV